MDIVILNSFAFIMISLAYYRFFKNIVSSILSIKASNVKIKHCSKKCLM